MSEKTKVISKVLTIATLGSNWEFTTRGKVGGNAFVNFEIQLSLKDLCEDVQNLKLVTAVSKNLMVTGIQVHRREALQTE